MNLSKGIEEVILLVEKFCKMLTQKIRNKMPDIDEERAEVINYGLQLVLGEIPKTIIILLTAWLLRILKLTVLAFLIIIPYRTFSGGVHLKTHIGCIIATTISYIGNAFFSSKIVLVSNIKFILIIAIWIFSIFMIKLYAPADTEAVPILRKKERRIKKLLSYITMTLNLLIAFFIKNQVISNLLIFGTLIQTITITRFIYKLTNNKYGYEEYMKNENIQTSIL